MRRGHHEAEYKVLDTGRVWWRVRVRYPDGTRARPSGTARNMTEAREAVRSRQEEARVGVRPVLERLTVGQMVAEYMAAKKGSWADRTGWNNDKLYSRYIAPHLGNLRAAGIDPPRLRAFFAALEAGGLGYSGQRQVHVLLSGAYKRAIADGALRDNPAQHARPVRSKNEVVRLKHFTSEQLQAFTRAALEDRDALPLAFLALTGLRLGEALALRWEDVQEDPNAPGAYFVTVSKTRSDFEGKAYENAPKTARGRRRVGLSPDALRIVQAMKGHVREEARAHGGPVSPYLFPSPYSGQPLRQDRARVVMRQTCERAGLPLLSPHALRHSAATFLISQGHDPVSVATYLGHAQTSTTLNFYAHAAPDRLRGLAYGLEDLGTAPAKEAAGKAVAAAPRPARKVGGRARKGGPRRG